MRIHRLALTHVRGISARTLTLDPSLPVLIEGPNEVGKTTMIEALDILFDYKHTSRDAKVRSLQPAHQDVPSIIETEITTGPYHFHYRKQYNREPSASLTLLQPRREHHQGGAAHERVTEILHESLDRQLWKSLRLLQADPLAPLNLGECSTILTALNRASNLSTPHIAKTEPLLAAITEEYRKHFTATGRPRGLYRASAEQLDTAKKAAEAAQTVLDEYDASVSEHLELLATVCALKEALQSATETRDHQSQNLAQLEHLNKQLDTTRKALEQAQRQETEAQARAHEREQRISDAADAEAQAHAHAQQATQAAQELEHVHAELTTTRAQAQAASRQHEKARAEQAHYARAVDYAKREAGWKQERERLSRAQQLAGHLAALNENLTGLHVTEQTLTELERLEGARQNIQAALETGSGTLTLRGGDHGLNVHQGEEKLHVPAGHSTSVPLTETIEYRGPAGEGFSFRPAERTRQRQQELARFDTELQEHLTAAHVQTLAEARERAVERRLLEQEQYAKQLQYENLLGADTLGELAERVLHNDRERQEHPGAPGDTSAPGDLPLLQQALAQATAAAETAAHAEKEMTEHVHRWERQEREIAVQVASRSSSAEAKKDEAARLQERLAAERQSTPDTHVLQQRAQAQAQAEQLRQRHAELTERLSPEALSQARDRYEAAQSTVERLSHEYAQQRERTQALQARIEVESSRGHYANAQTALKDRHDAAATYEQLDRRARAAKLLYETVTAHRVALHDRYRQPLQHHVHALGRQLFGSSFAVEVDEALAITSRTLNGVTVPYACLSFGAKEQLGLLMRLACARLVNVQEGVPLMIDDALGHSDPQRLKLFGQLLAQGAPHCQIIVMTCFPERYRGLGWPTVRLESTSS